jgi:hypothetical protein
MTTAAKRARKRANQAKGRPEEITPEVNEPTTTESEHAAALAALAKARKMQNREGGQ